MDVKMHLTINANGVPTAEVEESRVDCIIPCCDPDATL